MAFVDYKISSILRSGGKTTVLVRFYEGDNAGVPPVYQRTGKVQERELIFDGDVADDELRRVLNERLATLAATRGKVPHPTQAVTEPATARPTQERAQ